MNDYANQKKKVIETALKKMFEVVGAEYIPGKRYPKDWYRQRSWTVRRERRFKDWLVKLLQKKMGWPKRMASREAAWFLFDYGWKTES
jgi:hypothetical protein